MCTISICLFNALEFSPYLFLQNSNCFYCYSGEMNMFLCSLVYTRAEFAFGYPTAIAAAQLYGILPQIRPTNQMASRLFRFSRLVLIQPC